MGSLSGLRTLSGLISRRVLRGTGMFGGKRNFFDALGFASELSYEDYRLRYERGDIASRIVEAYPEDTWRDGAEILENTKTNITTFEKAVAEFAEQVQLWPSLQRADVLAGIGHYSVLLIGAPGTRLDEELPRSGNDNPAGIAYLNAYAEGNVRIAAYETNETDERFGLPTMYELVNLLAPNGASTVAKKVHWSRVIHVADGVLDNPLMGMPRLKKVWNQLDNLDKVVGGGSEAFWKTVFQGMQLDVDKDMDLDDEGLEDLKKQIDEFEHNLRRTFKTRGVKVNALGADTSDFTNQAHTILDLISATTKIPKRILLGSERGELASTQDRENWNDRIANRQKQFAMPYVVKPLITRLVQYGYLPQPVQPFFVRWALASTISLADKSSIAERLSKVNTNLGETVFTGNDIRDKVMGWDPITDEDLDRAEELKIEAPEPVVVEPAEETV